MPNPQAGPIQQTIDLAGLDAPGNRPCLGKEFDHEAIEEPGLFYLAGVAGSGQSFQFSQFGMSACEREGALMAIVLARRSGLLSTGDAAHDGPPDRVRERFELVDASSARRRVRCASVKGGEECAIGVVRNAGLRSSNV